MYKNSIYTMCSLTIVDYLKDKVFGPSSTINSILKINVTIFDLVHLNLIQSLNTISIPLTVSLSYRLLEVSWEFGYCN